MIKSITLTIFFSILLTNTNLENLTFKYSLTNHNSKTKTYTLGLSITNEKLINYLVCWRPSNNLIISTNYIYNPNNHKDDNSLFYNYDICTLTKNNLNIGFKINTIKYHKLMDNIKWNEYYINKSIIVNKFINIFLGYSFSYSRYISYSFVDININRKIFNNIYFNARVNNFISNNLFNFNIGIDYIL
tara:strand:- start:447 stop:1010 length:564 start_codon:yes stop_codon:yes gene_type:complete